MTIAVDLGRKATKQTNQVSQLTPLQQQLFIYVNALQNCKINCLYSVPLGKLEVIILITFINSGGTDSPAHQSSSTF